jgi:hypothetical protein
MVACRLTPLCSRDASPLLCDARGLELAFALATGLDVVPASEDFFDRDTILTDIFAEFLSVFCRFRNHVKRPMRNHLIDVL